jgi:hypothetical protein
MTAKAIRPFRCICEECEPLPPIKGLNEPGEAGEKEPGLAQRLLAAAMRKPGRGKNTGHLK